MSLAVGSERGGRWRKWEDNAVKVLMKVLMGNGMVGYVLGR